MKRKRGTTCFVVLLALLLCAGGATSQGAEAEGTTEISATVNSRISYQGLLTEDGTPVTGSRDMVFRLYSDGVCATQVGGAIVMNGVTVSDGLFSVELDVSHDDFDGQGLWLEVDIDGTAIGCQELLPVPYALSLRPGATISGSGKVLTLKSSEQYALWAETDATADWFSAIRGAARGETGATRGIVGTTASDGGVGVVGWATAGSGATTGVHGQTDSGTAAAKGVTGLASASSGATYGVYGRTQSSSDETAGVYGRATASSGNTYGVYGQSESTEGTAVYGKAPAASGQTEGVRGNSYSADGVGVVGYNGASDDGGTGVEGWARSVGVRGTCWSSAECKGVYGYAAGNGASAVYGLNEFGQGYGVYAKASGSSAIALYAEATGPSGTGLYAKGGSGGYAAVFEGTAQTQVLEITGGSDLAEPFEIAGRENARPGMVVAIDPEHAGQLRIADRPYDRTVAGCISGANGLNPGLILEQTGTVAQGTWPVALSGRVYCWAEAAYGAIQPGDLLTSSATPGHVMVVTDHGRATGAIIGKAMSRLDEGQGLVLVLVTLQ